MKAGIYLGKEKIEVRELPLPEIGDNDVLIENICSSICGTDVAVYKYGPETGHKITPGQEFGHETISRVVDIGANIADFNYGERVYPYPRNVKKDPGRAGTIGGFSEYIAVENAVRNSSLYPIPDDISDELACLIEPFTVGCRAARRGMRLRSAYEIANAIHEETTLVGDPRYASGENAVVFGCGTIGIAAAVALKWFGMDKVMICDLSDFRLGLANDLGFLTCNTAKEDFHRKAQSCFGTAPSLSGTTADIDCWIDAAGADSILEDFMQFGKIESRFVSVAVNKNLRNVDLLHMTYSQKSIIGSGGYMPEDVNDVIDIMQSHCFDLESIITHEFPIDQLEKAIQTAGDTEHAGNVIIRF